jgi:hypothetical protein
MERCSSALGWVYASLGVSLGALALVVGGCGGSSATAGSSSTSVGTTSAQRSDPSRGGGAVAGSTQLAVAEAICNRVNTSIAASKPANASLPEIARIVPRNAAIERRAAAELTKLRPPASIARDWRLVLGYRRTLAAELGTLVSDARRQDLAAIKVLSAAKRRVHQELLATASRAGLKECGRAG